MSDPTLPEHQPAPTAPYPVPGTAQPAAKRSWFARHKVLTSIGVAVVALTVVSIATSGGGAGNPAAPTSAAEDEQTQPPVDNDQPAAAPGIGTPVRDGKFEFTVTAIEPGVPLIGTDSFGQTAQGQFVLVHMTVTNIGAEAQYFDGSSQKAFDAQDRQFSADSGAAIYLPDSNSFLNEINPGNTVTGTVVFDIPTDATLTRLELHDSPFSGGTEVAL
ncbi:Mpr protein [Cellulomonas algicola]|uniref:Mpr protein n=1 Tax=Cellulomonas algicola TaxID=2071633 RepID=A0A401UX93_9CELL|nr:DUF4352 domain-containing protein [Cellulomonas algicola]GCD19317.1 Mpr protein [Cellulomonas algicola]